MDTVNDSDNEHNRLTDPELVFQTFELPAGDGRQITVWRSANLDRALRAAPILIAPGFGRRMSAFSPLAHYLALNGFEVIRYDPLDHVGSSSGDMVDFTMSTSLESMRIVADWMLNERGFDGIGIVATSLSARVAYRLVSTMKRIRFLVTAVGVTNLRSTLENAFGEDYCPWALDKLPKYVQFEKQHQIDTARFHQDCTEHDWWRLEGTVEELRDCPVPVVTFIGSEDTWVRESDVRAAFDGSRSGSRFIYTLAGSGHYLGHNAAIARQFFREITRASIMLNEGLSDLGEIEREPSFSALTQQSIHERRLQQPAFLTTSMQSSP